MSQTLSWFRPPLVPKTLTPQRFLKHATFFGNEIVAGTRRLCLMNMFFHGIGEMVGGTLVSPADALISPPSETYDFVPANPRVPVDFID